MPTYPEIREHIEPHYPKAIKNCHIAYVKAQYGLTTRKAHNRKSPDRVCYPCPDDLRELIVKFLRARGVLPE